MKEKIIKILESQFSVVEYEDPDTGFTESTTIDVLTTDEFPDIVDKLEILVNQEVEKRIAERMPSEEDAQNAESRYEDEQNEYKLRFDTEYCYRDYMNGWEDCRSRLTPPQVTPQVPYKTEGGGE